MSEQRYTPGYVDVPGKGMRYRNAQGEYFDNHFGAIGNSFANVFRGAGDAYNNYYNTVADMAGTEQRDGKVKPRKRPMASFGPDYAKKELELSAAADKSTPVPVTPPKTPPQTEPPVQPTGRDVPAPDGGNASGTQTSPRQMTMDEANKLLTGGYSIQNPFSSNALPATSASAYAETNPDVNYTRELPENMFIEQSQLKLTTNAYDAGSGVEYGQGLVQMPATGKIEYEQQAGRPLTAANGLIKASEPNEAAQKPEINKIPPRPRGGRQLENWERQYGRMKQPVEREKSELEKGFKPDMERRRAFLDAENSMQGLRRVEAQKGIVYQGQQHYMVNPNAGKEGQNDFIAIDKADRDAYMRGDQGAQDLKSKYVDAIKADGQKLTDTAPEGFTSAAQTPTSPIDRTAQVNPAQITEAPELTQQVDVRFTDKDKTGRYNRFI